MNPYDSPNASYDQAKRSLSIVRVVIATPFLLIGCIWCLLFIRTPQRVGEAIDLYEAGGWPPVISDAAFAESLWTCTVLPVSGLGLIALACGILFRNWWLIATGAVWAVTVFSLGATVR